MTDSASVELGQRLTELREAKGFRSRKSLADELGLHPETLAGYERGTSNPGFNLLREYSQRFSVDLHWLITGEGEVFCQPRQPGREVMYTDPAASARQEAIQTGMGLSDASMRQVNPGRSSVEKASEHHNMISLPQYDVNAKAGSGEVPVDQESVSAIWFERPFLRQMGATPDQCFVIEARGESMSPSIPDGALLVVDSSQTTVQNGCIYIFNVGDVVVVKRAIWSFSEQLTLQSDNPSPSYPDEVFDKKRASELNVVGRVVFYGRKA